MEGITCYGDRNIILLYIFSIRIKNQLIVLIIGNNKRQYPYEI